MNVPRRPICPRCGIPYTEHPALSRWDNSTRVCPDCGTDEALIQWQGRHDAGTDPASLVHPVTGVRAWVYPAPTSTRPQTPTR